jgi:hypothetical protein
LASSLALHVYLPNEAHIFLAQTRADWTIEMEANAKAEALLDDARGRTCMQWTDVQALDAQQPRKSCNLNIQSSNDSHDRSDEAHVHIASVAS